MKSFFVTVCLLLFGCSVFSQNQSNLYFWVRFKDKQNNSYSLSNPLQFLSQQSLDRRSNQGLVLDSTDLPVSPAYVDSIMPYINRVVHYIKWFNLVVVQINDNTFADSIKRFPFVDSVAPIITYLDKSLSVTNKLEAGGTPIDQQIIYPDVHGAAYHQLNMMNGDLLYQMGYRGQGMLIAMMDNGCNGVNTLHAFDSVRPHILDSWNFVDPQETIYNDSTSNAHGAETLGCIAGNLPYQYVGSAPDANFALYHTEDNTAEWAMEEYNWAAAAERADSMGAQVFTTSLGYSIFDDNLGSIAYSDLTGNKTMITLAGNRAFSKGILVFNSAGNEGQQPWYYIIAPADGDSIITVGAVDSARNVAAFSSRGPNAAGRIKPDLCAQGAVVAILYNGQPSTNGGTSFSCPLLAGCAACLWQAFPTKTAQEIKDAIMISADHFWSPDNNHGYGIPDFYNAYLLLKTNYNGNILRLSNDAAVYPSPFTTQLNVSLYNANAGYRTIELFDMLGRKVFSKQVYLRQGTFEIVTLQNLDGLNEGEYFLRIDGQQNFTHPVLKIK